MMEIVIQETNFEDHSRMGNTLEIKSYASYQIDYCLIWDIFNCGEVQTAGRPEKVLDKLKF